MIFFVDRLSFMYIITLAVIAGLTALVADYKNDCGK
jgi:hypothetical protein